MVTKIDAIEATAFFVNVPTSLLVDKESGKILEVSSERSSEDEVIYNPILVGVPDQLFPVYVVNDVLPDGNKYWVYNPLAGSINETAADRYFYKYFRFNMRFILSAAIKTIIHCGLVQRKLSTENLNFKPMLEGTISKELIALLSAHTEDGKTIISELDEKCFTEFEQYLAKDKSSELLFINYNQKKSTANLEIPLLSEFFFKDDFPSLKMRKKTFVVIRAIILQLLGGSMDNYVVNCPKDYPFKFYTTMRMYFIMFVQLQKWNIVNALIPDLDQYNEYLNKMSEYRQFVRFINTTQPTNDVKEQPKVAGGTTQPTQTTPQVNNASAYPTYPQIGIGGVYTQPGNTTPMVVGVAGYTQPTMQPMMGTNGMMMYPQYQYPQQSLPMFGIAGYPSPMATPQFMVRI